MMIVYTRSGSAITVEQLAERHPGLVAFDSEGRRVQLDRLVSHALTNGPVLLWADELEAYGDHGARAVAEARWC